MDGRWRERLLLVERRRRRRIARLLRAMERLERRASPRRRGGGHRRAASVVAALTMLLGGLFVASLLGDGGVSSSAFPDRPADAEDQRIGAPPAGRTTGGDFAFMATQDGTDEPVTYDPCVPIHVVVRPRTMVEGGMRLLQEAIDQVQDATGLRSSSTA